MNGSQSAFLLRDFVNSYDMDADVEEFGAPADLGAWLAERDLVPVGAHPEESDLVLAVGLREGLRGAMRDGTPPSIDVLGELPLRARFAAAGPELVPVGDGVRAGLAQIAAAIVLSRSDGSWERLKVCQQDSCQWAFLDTSKNRSRSWCSMRLCGNRTKTRAYRARQRDTAG
jgi:predicted RNA-binding Zn ribbon-like protein